MFKYQISGWLNYIFEHKAIVKAQEIKKVIMEFILFVLFE